MTAPTKSPRHRAKKALCILLDIFVLGIFLILLVGQAILQRIPRRPEPPSDSAECTYWQYDFAFDVACPDTFWGQWTEFLVEAADIIQFFLVFPIFGLQRDFPSTAQFAVIAVFALLQVFIYIWTMWMVIRAVRWLLQDAKDP
jgi:hypothetical protein